MKWTVLWVDPWVAQWIVGSGFTVNNATIVNSAAMAKGTFGGGASVGFPIDTGVILSTGDILLAKGPNDKSNAGIDNLASGDSDLDNLVSLGIPTANAAVLEFDVSSAIATTLTFEYSFASEEYPEFIGRFNDIMAIFINGANISPVLARVRRLR